MCNRIASIKQELDAAITQLCEEAWMFSKNPGKDFSRNRKLPFRTVISLLLSMEGGSEIESKAIEVERDSYDQDMQDFLEKYKYDPSLDSIQQYREEVDSVMVPVYRTGLSSEEYRSINEKRILFLNGQITIDQYITELERRFVFSVLENQ